MSAVIPASRWQARLELGFKLRLDKTIIAHRRHYGPLVVQKPFYPERETCHVYLIHPPGGVVGGDKIDLHVNVGAQAHALITTPAANKFYRSAGLVADVNQFFKLEDGAIFEWLPQENILFDHSQVNLHTRVDLGDNTRLLSWEMQCLGRPASGEGFEHGLLRQGFEIWQQGKPLFVDRSLIDGGSDMAIAPWGLAGFTVTATFVLFPASTVELEQVRQLSQQSDAELRFSSTLIGQLLICRGLARQAEPLKALFTEVWQRLRPAIIGKQAVIPRIWNT